MPPHAVFGGPAHDVGMGRGQGQSEHRPRVGGMDDAVVHLKAGDVLVQRGTIHNWVNRGTESCVIAFVLIDAKPVEIGGKILHAEG